MGTKQTLILASKSKRRKEILSSCGIRYKVFASRIREKFHHKAHPRQLVITNAKLKAEKVAQVLKKGIVLGCDTLVLFRSKSIGKPKNIKEARKFLRHFSGNNIFVYTGLCLIDIARARKSVMVAKTRLKVKRISADELERYLSLLGPYDKAGGFSIEGAGSMLFDNLEGSYFNVLGLPVNALAEALKKIDLNILDFIGRK